MEIISLLIWFDLAISQESTSAWRGFSSRILRRPSEVPRFAFRIRSIPRTRRKAPIKQQASVCERDQRRISDFTYGSARDLNKGR